MSDPTWSSASFWLRRIYNHNPFYVISAALVIYGLHVSFAGRLDPTEGWLLVRLLAGYTLMLAGAGIAVVRLGQVWEDARTLVCLVVVLLVALASSFDRVCLDDEVQGAKYLAAGFAFSLVLSELVIRGLRIRLPWTYRAPFYLQLALLFAYPAWLGRLSINDREAEMARYVLGLPALQAAITLLLAIAARRRGADVPANGTPWGWPWYPWPAFVLLGVAGVLRAFAMSMSFDNALGFAAGLEPYAFIPLALAWFVVCFEGTHGAHRPQQASTAVVAPLGLLLFALPGANGSPAQQHYLTILGESLGSPIQVAAVLLMIYYVYLWLRGVRAGEAGVFAALGVLSITDSATLSIDRLAPLQLVPACAALALLVAGAVWRGSSLRTCTAIVVILAAAYYSGYQPWILADRGYLPLHIAFAAILATGLAFRDAFARVLAHVAPSLLIMAAVWAAFFYRFVFPQTPPLVHAGVMLALATVAYGYRRRERRFDDLVAIAACLFSAGLLAAEQLVGDSLAHLMLRGQRWLAWGALFFSLGLAVSLLKGGQFRRLWQWLEQLHAAQQPPDGS